MNENIVENLTGEECASKIFEMSGAKFDPEIASELWAKIQQHKWLLSERLSRDVGVPDSLHRFFGEHGSGRGRVPVL